MGRWTMKQEGAVACCLSSCLFVFIFVACEIIIGLARERE